MEIKVDYDVCEANAVCEDICPEVFHVNEQDQLIVLQPNPPAELHDKVRQAVDRCPKAAITAIED